MQLPINGWAVLEPIFAVMAKHEAVQEIKAGKVKPLEADPPAHLKTLCPGLRYTLKGLDLRDVPVGGYAAAMYIEDRWTHKTYLVY